MGQLEMDYGMLNIQLRNSKANDSNKNKRNKMTNNCSKMFLCITSKSKYPELKYVNVRPDSY